MNIGVPQQAKSGEQLLGILQVSNHTVCSGLADAVSLPPPPPATHTKHHKRGSDSKIPAMEAILLLQTVDGNIANGIRLIIERTASV